MLWYHKCVLILALVGVVVGWGLAYAVEQQQTTITSNTMTTQSKDNRVIFEGSVVLTQGDLVVHSDRLIVLFKPSDQTNGNSASSTQTNSADRIVLIEARGRVFIEKGDGKARCHLAVYYKEEEKIVLTGSPVAWQGGTRVTGPKMTMYLKEDRSVVEGGSRALIMNEEGG